MSLSSAQESKALEHMQFLRYYHECSFLHPLKKHTYTSYFLFSLKAIIYQRVVVVA